MLAEGAGLTSNFLCDSTRIHVIRGSLGGIAFAVAILDMDNVEPKGATGIDSFRGEEPSDFGFVPQHKITRVRRTLSKIREDWRKVLCEGL